MVRALKPKTTPSQAVPPNAGELVPFAGANSFEFDQDTAIDRKRLSKHPLCVTGPAPVAFIQEGTQAIQSGEMEIEALLKPVFPLPKMAVSCP
jgi:hypothetical protein